MVDFIGAARDPQFRQDVGQGLVDAFGRGLSMVGGAPVDLTTMFLRPLGYSVPDEQIVGSSEYIGRQMANLGLISETRNPAAEFLSALLIPDPTDIQKLAPYVQRAMSADLVAARPSTPGAAMRAQRGSVGVEPLTVGDISNKWSEKGVALDVFEPRNQSNTITLSKIEVPEDARKSGLGTQAMNDIVEYANKTGKTITLSPSTDFGASSKKRLVDFYKRFGFVENKGKNKDFSISESMYRLPDQQTR